LAAVTSPGGKSLSDYLMMTAQESLENAQSTIRRIIAARDDRNSLVTQIAIEVGAEIIEDVVPPGHDLNSVDLARRYETSRTPIREALMLLEKESLVDIPPRRRPRVKVMDVKTVREIYRTRAAILELVAVDVVENASAGDLDMLTASVERMAHAYHHNDLRAYIWANIAFHDLNLTVSKNMTAKRIVESLLLRTIHLRRHSLSREGRLTASLDDHVGLVKAYRNGDANLAAALVRANHFNALRNIEHLDGASIADADPAGELEVTI
jgi:DNA-binding GntR family transcriptional regulator